MADTNQVRIDYSPEYLLSLAPGQFQELVNRDMRLPEDLDRQTEDDQALRVALRVPAVATRLYDTLLVMQKSVEGQLAAKKEDLAAIRVDCLLAGERGREDWLRAVKSYARWRAGSLRFKTGVERVMFEARELRGQARDEQLRDRVQTLEDAILRHRDGADVGRAVDFELWSVVRAHRVS